MKNLLKLLVILLFCSCNEIATIKSNDVSIVNNLIEKGISEYKSASINSIGNAFEAKITDKDIMLIISDSIDQKGMLIQNTTIKKHPISISFELNGFEICIKEEDSIIISGLHSTIDVLENSLYHYFLYLKSFEADSAMSDSQFINSLVHVSIFLNNGDSVSKKFWRTYFNIIYKVELSYQNMRDKLSEKYYGKRFSYLPFEKKLEIYHYMPMNIVLTFNNPYCSKFIMPSDINNNLDNEIDAKLR